MMLARFAWNLVFLLFQLLQFEEEDNKRKDAIEQRNQAESVIHDTEKNVSEFKDQLSAEDVCFVAHNLASSL